MLCEADSIGVFQVESRAQMATLPRLKPREFYDLVVEVALIRPGPIQGGSVHPYIRRRSGQERITYPHKLMRKALRKTLGIPLFQEQLMQLAIDVAGFDANEADQLRRAMSAKRSMERMNKLRERLYEGMAANGIAGAVADDIYLKLSSFANFGFPESHAMSFAYLVFASAWLKRYHPAAFCAALLGAQPMGFYSTQTLVDDARRHGVEVPPGYQREWRQGEPRGEPG
jgi:error-prone DNA polymerase